jgi:mono/diheme cytochrome c family protein
MTAAQRWKRRLLKCLVLLVVLGATGGAYAWFKFFRVVPQPEFASKDEWFKHMSLGAESDRGIPYWIWYVLPRIFPDYLPGPGGYKSFGLAWEPGDELPSGFAKKTVGFPRITNNCAVCHTATYRTALDEAPRVVVGGPGHTTNIQAMIRFLSRCAKDSRFNADVILDELSRVTKLSKADRLIYRYALIPLTRRALIAQEGQFAWMNRPGWPDWGPGRDDPMNLTKYFMTHVPMDQSTGQADFPSIWNLKVRDGEGKFLNWSGDTPSPRSVLIDSALGLGAPAGEPFLAQMDELLAYLKELPPPKYPLPVDQALAAQGKTVYAANCAECHAVGGKRTSTVIPIAEIGTDRERLDTWTKQAADAANQAVKDLGITRPNMVKQEGYLSPPLDGAWLRGPYLHNGSVATLRELLERPEHRAKAFWRGCDLLDPVGVGFVSSGPEAERTGWRLDTAERGNGNQGHAYGTDLSEDDKRALVEYLKTE